MRKTTALYACIATTALAVFLIAHLPDASASNPPAKRSASITTTSAA
jgi:hypothetical protein